MKIIVLILLLCSGMTAQERSPIDKAWDAAVKAQGKQKQPDVTLGSGGTSVSTLTWPVTTDPTSGYFVWKAGANRWIAVAPATQIVPTEPATCTRNNLIKALRIATESLADPNASPSWLQRELIFEDYRTPAEKLRAQAQQIEEQSERVQWVRAVLADCK